MHILFQYKDLYNIPQSAFDNALNENEIESEVEEEEEYEREVEMEGEGDEYVMADSDDESIVRILLNYYKPDKNCVFFFLG